MTALDNTPYNKNFLNPLNFNFYIKRAPYVNFFVQSVNLPGFGFTTPLQQTPFSNIPQTGDRIIFQDLEVTFKVDEELQNYLEIANWIRSIGFPENFEQYAGIKANRRLVPVGIPVIVESNGDTSSSMIRPMDNFLAASSLN